MSNSTYYSRIRNNIPLSLSTEYIVQHLLFDLRYLFLCFQNRSLFTFYNSSSSPAHMRRHWLAAWLPGPLLKAERNTYLQYSHFQVLQIITYCTWNYSYVANILSAKTHSIHIGRHCPRMCSYKACERLTRKKGADLDISNAIFDFLMDLSRSSFIL